MNQVFSRPVGRLVEGDRSQLPRRPFGPIAAYWLAAVAGGSATGAALGALGAAARGLAPHGLEPVALVLAGALASAAIFLELRGRVYPLPQWRRQVPRRWTRWENEHYTAAAFGLMLGTVVLTFLHHATAYVLGLVVVLAASPLIGVVAGAVYGMTRGTVLAYAWYRREPGTGLFGPATIAARLLPLAAVLSFVTVLL